MADTTQANATRSGNTGIDDGRLTVQAAQAGTGTVVARIESILELTLDRLAEAQEMSIELASRRNVRHRGDNTHLEQIRFPGRTLHEAKKFARLLLILQLSHDALVSGTILTKRHIFYQHQELFEKQSRVDELVDDLALTLGVTRDNLNIVAAAKGVLSGPMTIRLSDDTLLDASTGDLGMSIPLTRSIANMDFGAVRWVLVVEKDAIFRSLLSSRFWQASMFGPGLLVTAKGYPDLITRSFLQLVNEINPQLPIFVLVDFDPDGLNIFRCYRYGSGTVGQRAVSNNEGIRWLGIKTSHILELAATVYNPPTGVDELINSSQSSTQSSSSRVSMSSTACREPISHLSARDRKVAVGTLTKLSDADSDDDEAVELRREFQVMLMMGVKAEIQWLDESGSITDWLDDKIGGAMSALT